MGARQGTSCEHDVRIIRPKKRTMNYLVKEEEDIVALLGNDEKAYLPVNVVRGRSQTHTKNAKKNPDKKRPHHE